VDECKPQLGGDGDDGESPMLGAEEGTFLFEVEKNIVLAMYFLFTTLTGSNPNPIVGR
jgi:hypothetical protein